MKSLTAIAALIFASTSVQACGVSTDCTVGDRIYRIAVPEGGPDGAILFAHGYRGSAAGAIRNSNFRNMVTDMGLAFVALDAGASDDWHLPNSPSHPRSTGAREFDYVGDVIADLRENYDIASDRIMVTGFSAGGMLVWNLACARPDLAGGFAPVSGTFWLAPPDTCTQPAASIIHMHGDSDRIVPLAGRPIGTTHQGDVTDSLAFFRAFGGFTVTGTRAGPGLTCDQSANASGDILEFCQFAGGHSFSRNYVRDAWERFVAAGQIAPDS